MRGLIRTLGRRLLGRGELARAVSEVVAADAAGGEEGRAYEWIDDAVGACRTALAGSRRRGGRLAAAARLVVEWDDADVEAGSKREVDWGRWDAAAGACRRAAA